MLHNHDQRVAAVLERLGRQVVVIQGKSSMQAHEGPRRDRNAEQPTHQRRLAGLLSPSSALLLVGIALNLGPRWR